MEKSVPLLVVIAFSILSVFSLLHPGLPPTHDGEYHIIRFYEFDKVLRSGVLYPRWAPDLNNKYGVPLFNYVYPLPNYLASFLHLFNVSFIDSFKIIMFFSGICGGVFFYLWAKQFFGIKGGIVSSLFYTFSPYHFLDVFIRGSVGEVIALALFPAFLWAITNLITENKRSSLLLSSIFLSLIIFSHNILALMFFPFALLYAIFLVFFWKKSVYTMLSIVLTFLLGVGMSSIFWIPAFLEQHFVTGLEIYNIERNFPQLYQLIIPSWGSSFLQTDFANQMSFQIGLANCFAVCLSFLVFLIFVKKKNKNATLLFFFLAWFILIFLLMLKISLPIWQNVPLIHYFQFPWRFLSIEILLASFLSGGLVYFWQSNVLMVLLASSTLLLGIGYSKPAYYHMRNDKYYISRDNFIYGTNSPGNYFNTRWMNKNLGKKKNYISFLEGISTVKTKSVSPTKFLFSVINKEKSEAKINIACFPGWTVFVDNKIVPTQCDKNGLLFFSLPPGIHEVNVVLLNTPIQNLASALSIISFLFLLTLTFHPIHGTIRK